MGCIPTSSPQPVFHLVWRKGDAEHGSVGVWSFASDASGRASRKTSARCKSRLAPPTPFSLEAFQAVDAEIRDLRVATLGQEAAAQRSPEDGKRSPVELY